MLKPVLRFQNFLDSWTEIPLSEILTEYNEKANKSSGLEHVSLTKDGVIPKTAKYNREHLVKNAEKSYRITNFDDICYNPANLKFNVICRNTYGKSIFSPIYVTFKINDGYSPAFVEALVTRQDFIGRALRYQQGTVYERTAVSPNDLLRMKVAVPTKDEQEKISNFILQINTFIDMKQKELENIKNSKYSIMQKIFSNSIRFKDSDGNNYPNWEKKPLDSYLYENKERNKKQVFKKEDVLSVSKDFGVINQIEYFGKSLAGNDLSNYHCVDVGDVIYTKSPLGEQPYGIIKQSEQKGIVSTLYAVYHCRDNILPKFVDYYFERNNVLNAYLKPLVNIGAKHDMKIHNDVAISGEVLFPQSVEEQGKIVALLSKFDLLLKSKQNELDAAKNIKRGLIQKIFI